MMTYIKLGKIRGLFVEFNKEFGSSPFFQKNTFHHETIIDIPYAQFIYTSGRWRPVQQKQDKGSSVKKIPIRSASNVNQENGETTECPKRVHGR